MTHRQDTTRRILLSPSPLAQTLGGVRIAVAAFPSLALEPPAGQPGLQTAARRRADAGELATHIEGAGDRLVRLEAKALVDAP